MDFKLDYPRSSCCFGKSLVQKTVETVNIPPMATYANYTHCSRVSCCCDETTKCLNSFKANNSFLPEGNFQPPCKSFSYQLVSPFFHFSRCGNVIFAIKASLVRFLALSKLSKITSSREIHSTQKFLLLELL